MTLLGYEDNVSVKLDLGCGNERLPGYIGFDIRMRGGTDVICDLQAPIPLADACAAYIRTKSLFEHIEPLEPLLAEVWRVLKPGGTLYVYVPHWSNPFFYSDYTHRRFFGLATFDYFSDPQDQVYRRVPVYTRSRFQTISVRLIFESPFRWPRFLMKGFQWVVNRGVRLQLLYEYHLSALVPCYAVEYVVRRRG